VIHSFSHGLYIYHKRSPKANKIRITRFYCERFTAMPMTS
jgi:hypothetical protein